MNIKINDLSLLMLIEAAMYSGKIEEVQKHQAALAELIDRLQAEREKQNKRTAQAIAIKRKANKNYARSKH